MCLTPIIFDLLFIIMSISQRIRQLIAAFLKRSRENVDLFLDWWFNVASYRSPLLTYVPQQHCTCQIPKHTQIMYELLFNHNRNRSIVRSIYTVNVDGEQLTLEFGTHWNINACYGSTRKNKSKTGPVMGPSHVTQRLTRRCYLDGTRYDNLFLCLRNVEVYDHG